MGGWCRKRERGRFIEGERRYGNRARRDRKKKRDGKREGEREEGRMRIERLRMQRESRGGKKGE